MMLSKTVFFLVFGIVFVLSEDSVKRVKRAQYSYPSRFYRLPPPPHVIKGPFSYTPPPNYKQDDDSPPFRYPKVSKKPNKPTYDGLGDQDISNLVKYLSKKDLDKIVEFAGEKERYADKYTEKHRENSAERSFDGQVFKRPERERIYKNEDEKFSLNGPFIRNQDDKQYKVEYQNEASTNYERVKPRIIYATPPTYPDGYMDNNPNSNFVNDASQTKVIYAKPPDNHNAKIVYSNPQDAYNSPEITKAHVVYANAQGTQIQNYNYQANPDFNFSNHQDANTKIVYANSQANQGPFQYLNPEESMRHFVTYVTPSPNMDSLISEGNIFTNSDTMKEEQLPKPLNLREDDQYEGSNSDQVPKVVRSNTYKVESFKDVPLMNFHNSKLHTVSSYNVPHYTITSNKSQNPPVDHQSAPIKVPTIEQAPPGYTGEEMSDAHLKAVKIWTHHSSGTAYTLHDDGTLSLKKPQIKTSYGYA